MFNVNKNQERFLLSLLLQFSVYSSVKIIVNYFLTSCLITTDFFIDFFLEREKQSQ